MNIKRIMKIYCSIILVIIINSCTLFEKRVSEDPLYKYLYIETILKADNSVFFITLESDEEANNWYKEPVRICANKVDDNGKVIEKIELGITDNGDKVRLVELEDSYNLFFGRKKFLHKYSFSKDFKLVEKLKLKKPKFFTKPLMLSKDETLIFYENCG